MIDLSGVYAVTLAAGLSTRFGGDKLFARIGDATVLDHSLAMLDAHPFGARAVVLDHLRAKCWSREDIAVIHNDAPERGMGYSLALAAQDAIGRGASFLLVTLGDMPCLSAGSIGALLVAAPDAADALLAMKAPNQPAGPPALFGNQWFNRLADRGGEDGARQLLRDAALAPIIVPLDAAEAIDIDTRADLERAAVKRLRFAKISPSRR